MEILGCDRTFIGGTLYRSDFRMSFVDKIDELKRIAQMRLAPDGEMSLREHEIYRFLKG